jgi:signal transduction histidine kinase
VQRQDGTTFSALITDNPIYDETGDLIGVVGVSVDITARKRAEEASHFLAAASAVLTASLDDTQILWDLARLAVPQIADWCAVDMVDGDRTFRRVAVTHTDPAKVEIAWEIERRYGFDPDLPHGAAKVLRTGHAELYPEITEALLAQVAHDEEHLRLLNLVGLRSGMIVPLVARGRTLGALSFGIAESQRRLDVDDLHLAEDLANRAALAVDNARLYQDSQVAVQLRDEFLSVAAHELKTPVTAIVGYSQVLRRRVDQALNPRDRRALQVLAEQAERLSRLVNSLLDASRIQIGQFNLERRPVDLGKLARRIAGEMARTLPGHSLEYRQPSEPVIIDGDALRLEQVLLNLLQNAVKYSPKGGPITLSVERRDSEAVLFVSDQGIGIPAAAMPLLFQRFFRAGNAAGSTLSGMGVGLYVVQEIVSRHGGRVGVESTEGKGTTVTVYLPLRESQPQTT